MEFWTKEEYLQFIEAVKDKDISFYAFEILYWTGIRLGELRALTKADFDFDKKTMRISKSAQGINGEEIITDPKTPKSKRTIMLPDFLIRELKDYFLKIEYFSEDEQIFPKCKTYFNKEMERGIKKSKVKKIKLHTLRHSHISLLIEMGFTPVDIAASIVFSEIASIDKVEKKKESIIKTLNREKVRDKVTTKETARNNRKNPKEIDL